MQLIKIAAALLSVSSLSVAGPISVRAVSEPPYEQDWNILNLDFYCEPPAGTCRYSFDIVPQDSSFSVHCEHKNVPRASKEYLACVVGAGQAIVANAIGYLELKPARYTEQTTFAVKLGFNDATGTSGVKYYKADQAGDFNHWLSLKKTKFTLTPSTANIQSVDT